MNTKSYLIGSIVVFIVMYLLDYLFHGIILAGQYEMIQHILRTPEAMMTYMPAMLLADLIMAFGFGYIFIRGREGKGIGEGIRYGLLIGFVFGVGPAMINYAVFPLTGWIMLAYFFGYPIECMILGAIFAAIYKPAKPTPIPG